MKVIVIGSGGREHALAWSLLQSAAVEQVFCLPGNGGTATLDGCHNIELSSTDFEAIAAFALQEQVGLVVIGPEVPLAAGITDVLTSQGLRVFGPTQAAAQIEASKTWAKALMVEAGIPTAQAATFGDAKTARAYVTQQGVPIVIKADGLAAGKGVTVASTVNEAIAAINATFGGQFGAAGSQVVIEECLTGVEVSVLALTDGKTIVPLLPAQDHKRIGEGDTGPNTGGMGAYAPAPLVRPELLQRIEQDILQPAIVALQGRGIDYRGVLYAGLMITPTGEPKVIEFNCRFGDPEAQVVLPLLQTPLLDLLQACVDQTLAQQLPLQWYSSVAACVVAASGGYPGAYTPGKQITGLQADALIFHAGTKLDAATQKLVTSGGRVLNVVATATNFAQAFQHVEQALQQIQFEGMYYRRDIGYQVRS
ncbi:MAG: phosphoribosylamine--glycine ligase [Cyanobacteria bacterium P01_H01_bin.121]